MTAALFDAPRKTRTVWHGNVLPVAAPRDCPRTLCAGTLVALPSFTQPALFFHGGYGGAERFTCHACPSCGWFDTATVETVNPRRL